MPEFTGGQKSRVALAKVTFQRPHILLLDEPSNHLDIDAVEALVQVQRDFNPPMTLTLTSRLPPKLPLGPAACVGIGLPA